MLKYLSTGDGIMYIDIDMGTIADSALIAALYQSLSDQVLYWHYIGLVYGIQEQEMFNSQINEIYVQLLRTGQLGTYVVIYSDIVAFH